MSYTPILIIESDKLKRVLDEYEVYDLFSEKDEERVIAYLQELFNNKPTVFKNIDLYICQPEFTQFNSDVRDFLNKWEIEYGICN